MPKPSPDGATFAERAAAARGDKDFTPLKVKVQKNSTFGSRAKGSDPVDVEPEPNSSFSDRKAVDAEDDGAENKAVAKKAASKKS